MIDLKSGFVFLIIHVNPTSSMKPLFGVGLESLCCKRTAAQSRLSRINYDGLFPPFYIFFSLGIFSVYIIFGVGLFSVLQEKSTASMFRSVLAAVLLVLGLMQLQDARRLQGGGTSLFRVDWTKKYVHGVIASRRLSSYFLLGALFSLVRAPCVGGVYIAIIGIISSQGYASSGLIYLMIYNLGIALPVLVLGGIIALGMSPEQVDQFRNRHRVAIRLVTGITLFALAPFIYTLF